MSAHDASLDELILSDETVLPKELREKLKRSARERDDEPTQVTKLFEELEEEAEATKAALTKTGRAAQRVSRLTRNPGSQQNLRLVLSGDAPKTRGK